VRRFAGDDVQQVVVIGGRSAPRRPLLRGSRPRAASPESAPVDITRATVIEAAPLGDLDAADAWLARATGADADRITGDALALLDRTVAAHRVAAADPRQPDPDPARALVCRVGYGTGEQVADGDWEAARELPRKRRRSRALAPQERLAALLSGRDAALACEELTLRARADLDRGRTREAALQASVALEAALAELEAWREISDIGRRLDELAAHRDPVAGAAAAALRSGLEPAAIEAVEAAVGRIEAALRARAVAAH
jgi:hypothetical protein